MAIFFIFLAYLWSNLWWFLTSGPLVVEPMLDYLIDGYEEWANQFISRQKRRQIAYGLSLFGIVLASFLAFKDVYIELQTVQHTLAETQKMLAAKGPEEKTRAIARLEATNVQLQNELRSTQNALSAVQDSLKARRLNPEERRKFIDILAAHQGRQSGDLYVAAFPSCHECMTYVHDLANAINSVPGWTTEGMQNYLIKVDFSGIGISMRDPKFPPPVVPILADALKAAGI
jgi:hypothetical protein